MKDSTNYDYDAIIIGAGISGLVCGCYLAKAGLKTLIVEKNSKVGGYCTSFTRNGFHFDACVYSLSSFRQGGILNKIFNDFDLKSNFKLIRHDISDTIITPNYKISLFHDVEKSIGELSKSFPQQRSKIESFLKLIYFTPLILLTKYKNFTLKDLLDLYFDNGELRTILTIALLGYTGLPPSTLSAFVAILIFREFIFDGGYYPEGGMQRFSDALALKMIEYGGEIQTFAKVSRILLDNNQVKGIQLESGKVFNSKLIISACDIHETFFELIDYSKVPKTFLEKIDRNRISLSAFLVYLGLSKDLEPFPELKSHTWVIANNCEDIEKIYTNLLNEQFDFIAMSSPTLKDQNMPQRVIKKESLFLFVNMMFRNKPLRDQDKIVEELITLAEEVIPDLGKFIKLQFTASPSTLYRWTLNYDGAAYGWADTISHFGDPDFSERTKIKHLFLAGHWSNKSSGVTSVANSGFLAAESVIRESKKIKGSIRL